MLPACEVLDKVGYYSLECWGGATFDACLRFLNEDPWERLRTAEKGAAQHEAADAVPRPEHSGLQALCRRRGGRFRSASRSKNGIDVIRIFDALNDTRNLAHGDQVHQEVRRHLRSGDELHRKPRAHRGILRQSRAASLKKMGADSICIKDMANLLLPYQTLIRW